MKKIFLLTDHKGHFGSKHNAVPYRSGMDKELLKKYFAEKGYNAQFLKFCDVDFENRNFKDQYVLYTSQEDVGYYYKNYIEDIIYGLTLQGAKVIPSFKYLRAHNNKVFAEILRNQMNHDLIKNIQSHHFGSLEEMLNKIDQFEFPVVIKSAEGAMGSGVCLAKNKDELIKNVKKISRARDVYQKLWDFGRSIKHKGYIRESKYRKKFIIQNFIPNLKNDWKIYVFGNKYFIFYRPILKHRKFRASGGGYDNYLYGQDARSPGGIFDFAKFIFNKLRVPHASLDIAFDGDRFYLLEFQCVYFGTAGILNSKEYFIKQNKKWVTQRNIPDIERVYVESIVEFVEKLRIN